MLTFMQRPEGEIEVEVGGRHHRPGEPGGIGDAGRLQRPRNPDPSKRSTSTPTRKRLGIGDDELGQREVTLDRQQADEIDRCVALDLERDAAGEVGAEVDARRQHRSHRRQRPVDRRLSDRRLIQHQQSLRTTPNVNGPNAKSNSKSVACAAIHVTPAVLVIRTNCNVPAPDTPPVGHT